jgi:hypothetical protein
MHDLIRWTVQWLRLVFAPGTGKRRAGARLVSPARVQWPDTACTAAGRLPAYRSPYGLDGPLDGGAVALVRPYIAAHEQECARQRRRRLALVLAADFGVDLDRHLIGAREVAA